MLRGSGVRVLLGADQSIIYAVGNSLAPQISLRGRPGRTPYNEE